jgi:DNA repair exonuclease SbcCD ATPase subunit/DNA repair exonuclease SbcCD nuclease subunit
MKPKKIFHIGDQHVFFTKKFEAHEYVFNQLYKDIEREKPELIVCVGDLIDSKLKLSPEQFNLARGFLLNLASYCPVLIILGNHDLNLQNKERLDSISPIVYSLNNETKFPIHFFKHSGLYELYNIKWAIWSCLDDQLTPEIVREDNDYVIGLYHGAVKGCISDNGFILSDGIDIEEFKDCDRVMLADIHKQQSFRNGEIVYSGSILQTKISEPAKGSYIMWEWDGKNYNHTVHRLNNIYSTITENIDDVDLIKPDSDDQVIMLKYDSNIINKAEALKMKKEIQTKFPSNKIELKASIKKKVRQINTIEEQKEKKKIDLQNAMQDYLKALKLSAADIKAVMDMDLLYTSNLDLSKDFELGDFSICWMELSNFLSFAPHTQMIDLDKEGIIGIGGKNRVGKSSVIKAIMFCLFNSSPDNNASLKKLINKNNRNQESFVRLVISKAGKYYRITRTLIPKKNGVTSVLEFLEVDEFNNEIKSLTGEKRQETEKELQRYFGIESAFEILSLYSAQKRQQELIDCKNAERLKLVNRFIGLHNYEYKLEAVNEDLKAEKVTYTLVTKDFNQSADLVKMESELLRLTAKEIEIKDDISDLQDSERIYEFKNRHLISSYELNKKLASKIVSNPEEVKEEIKTLNEYIIEREEYKIEVERNIELFKIDKDVIATKWDIDYSTDISKHKIEWRQTANKSNELAVLKSEIEKSEKQLLENECYSCGQEISVQKKEELAYEIKIKKANALLLETVISDYDIICKKQESLQDEYNDIKDKIEQCEVELKKVSMGIKTAETKIENLELKTKDWDEVQSAKERLSGLEREYLKFTSHKKDSDKTLEMLQNDLGAIRTTIKLLQRDITQYKTQYTKLQESEEKMRLLKLYKDIVNKDGLPLYILKSKIDEINEQVNLVVSQVFEFEVEFSVDEESGELNVDFFYENDTEKNDVGFASGSETFIINLCIKVGLSQVSELPKLTSLLIDEGYGTLDKDTIDKIPALFAVLPEYYKNVITISHIDELKDLYNYEIKLQKNGKHTEVTN